MLSFFFFFVITLFFIDKNDFLMEFLFSSTLPFSVTFFFTQSNFLFFFTVFLISACVFMYSLSYLESDFNLKRFLWLLSFFIFSMFFFLLSGSFFSTFIGWDFLGLSSLFLIWFYQNHSSLKAGVLTFFMNRLGDGLFIISMIFFFTESFNLLISESVMFTMSSIFLVFTSMSKSALFPFSAWLPAAMQAPTPVSSLVHSSTLITAGFFLIFRFFDILNQDFLKNFLFIIALSTAFMASSTAMVEMDLKKVIAFSTLSHISFIFILLSYGNKEMSFFYMLVHAFFKAVMFMCAGVFIHQNSNNQDIRMMKILSKKKNPVASMIFSFSILSMSGFPFLSGFFSKDMSLDIFMMYDLSILFYLLFFSTTMFTMLYSFRIIWFSLPEKSSWKASMDSFGMIIPMIPLLMGAVFLGSSMSWIYLNPSFFIESSKTFFLSFSLLLLFFLWFYGFFHKKKSFFLKNMWYLSCLSNHIFYMFFFFLKKSKMYEDLQGFQGYILNAWKMFQLKNLNVKKVSNFFLEKPEIFLLVIILMIFFF